jgi:hypothetical protein
MIPISLFNAQGTRLANDIIIFHVEENTQTS